MIHWHRIKTCAASTALLALLAACGGGGDGSSNTGKLNLSITDAPVDGAVAVVLTVDSATLQGVEGAADQGPFDVNDQFDLLSYQGTASRVLLVDTDVVAGTYKVRLDLDLTFNKDNPNEQMSYIAFPPMADSELCPADRNVPPLDGAYREDVPEPEVGNCRYPLRVPSGEQAGFRPKGNLVINADASSSFTVEFDLRKNMVDPANADITYVLKPTGLRLVNDATVGIIRGNIAASLFGEAGCSTPEVARVYLYDLSKTVDSPFPDDIDGEDETYVTSVGVEQVPVPDTDPPVYDYNYIIGFVGPGTDYALAMTCDNDTSAEEDLTFVGETTGIEVVANSTTTQDFN